MTYSEIDEKIDGGLPPPAWTFRQWWENDRGGGHTQSRHGWLDVGWENESVELGRSAVFRKVVAI